MADLKIAPKGARVTAGFHDRQRIKGEVSLGLSDIRHSMDVRAEDCQEDLHAWTRLEADLVDLLFRAYARNHNLDPS